MGRVPAADTRLKEQRVVALRRAGKSFDEIADEVGYASRGAAYDAFIRRVRAESSADVAEIRDLELSRLDAMHGSLWPVAIGDLNIVPQWVGKGKNRRRVICEEEDPDEPDHKHFEDEAGALQCWVIPDAAKLEAIEKCLKIMKRRADYLGLDFQHGLDERKQALEEQTAHTLAGVLGYILKAMNPTPEQQLKAEQAFMEQLQLVGNEPKAITVETTP
jgi:hypothetical protein